MLLFLVNIADALLVSWSRIENQLVTVWQSSDRHRATKAEVVDICGLRLHVRSLLVTISRRMVMCRPYRLLHLCVCVGHTVKETDELW